MLEIYMTDPFMIEKVATGTFHEPCHVDAQNGVLIFDNTIDISSFISLLSDMEIGKWCYVTK